MPVTKTRGVIRAHKDNIIYVVDENWMWINDVKTFSTVDLECRKSYFAGMTDFYQVVLELISCVAWNES